MEATLYFGIDVGKLKLDLASSSQFISTFDNDQKGIKQLIAAMKKHAKDQPWVVVIEASSVVNHLLCQSLWQQGIALAILCPNTVHHYRQAVQQRAKNDRLDAQLLAQFAQAHPPTLSAQPDTKLSELAALQQRREQVVADRVQEAGRLENCVNTTIAKLIQKHIKQLDKQVKQLEAEIAKLIATSEEIKAKVQALDEETGVGKCIAVTLITDLPQLGKANRQEIAALAGLAPFDNESGSRKGNRHIAGGRKTVRRALYIAALSAMRYHPQLKLTYQKLRDAGKASKVAIIAVARKLLIRLNSKMKDLLKTLAAKAGSASKADQSLATS